MSPSSSRASRRNSLASEAVRLLLFMALLGVLSATTMQSRAQAGDRPTLVLGGDANFPPYEFLDANGRPAGFHVDLMRAVGDAMGFDVEVRLGPWDEVRSGLTAGEIDVVAMFESANRSEFEFTQPHDAVTHRLYVRLGEGEARPRSLGDLAGVRVIVQRDGYVHDYLKQQELDTELIFTVSETEALRRLAAGEGDVAVLSQSIGHHLADTPVMAKLTTSGPTLLEARYCFAVARGRFDLLTQIESGDRKSVV